MIQISLPRKNIKRNLNIRVDPYIFPDSVIKTPFIKTIEKIISDNLDKLDTPTIDDYYKTTDILMDKTKHHMKLTTYKERAIIEDLQGSINTTLDPDKITADTLKLREILGNRERSNAINRSVNYKILGQKGTRMYFASLKARDTNTKIKVLGTDIHETTDPLEITKRLLNPYSNVFCSKPLHTSIFDYPELNCIKNIISKQQILPPRNI